MALHEQMQKNGWHIPAGEQRMAFSVLRLCSR
jgi:hypothetical protein